ncbi:Beta-ketodecanoyl-[acyl-carrier-protein] synthase [Zhongshania aliphaticivorans]|uniref:Beta-ketodecanoyl-[acyl-carrier-protein] synthase n=1 Tax=Zhongshania aliphaticivorans TaxID=1470434 RepID=A0A5S9MYS3_9GAMM|nr:beta-ketoacyl-ACP synthase III [Zhongshania aliphaticivorans]CAA0080759.1 Beta-ketodecanoyl-[acyl-carrier-protein] synthase [Zhongshania aliphaticivorans]CAA0085393.1 Beta-ketodecanoyl-[acyl-carrier-protein] synthase [Zhongshania aliphaticivorans]
MNSSVVISGVGLWTPTHSISNEELVSSYNAYAEQYNLQNKAAIEAGELDEKPSSSPAFIEKASGIKSRFVLSKEGILDINRMRPYIEARGDDEVSHQAEMSIAAAKKALASANKTAADIDMVIVSCAYTQRSYPAIAIEVQAALGIEGFGFDMLVACSAATFGLERAVDAVKSGTSKGVLVINPELTSPQVNFKDRDSHFIFGDVATATVIESSDTCTSDHAFDILSTKCVTSYSNNIRSNFGHITHATDEDPYSADKMFHQNGRKVFKEVCPMAAEHIETHLQDQGIAVSDLKRWWLHQANLNMNLLISRRLLGRDATLEEAPVVLDEYANTASAGSIIAFAKYHDDLDSGDIGVICSFGAGYSIGSLVLRKR